jgi:xanthine dehydrogenase YagS FAD-binding subunit
MNPFQYLSAKTADQAREAAGPNARYLAGGIDLLGEMKDYIVSPDVLVNVKEIASHFMGRKILPPKTKATVQVLGDFNSTHESESISYSPMSEKGWWIGSLATIADIADHPEIKTKLPGLAEAASEVGSPQIRNVATLGGNLLQHSRCWYYRQPDIVCLKRGGTSCYAKEGENKYLSLFSGCACVTAFTSNLGVMLSALDGTIFLAGGTEKAEILGPSFSMRKLYSRAWLDPTAHHSLKPSDLMAGIGIPYNRTHSAYRQVSEKSEFDWALVSCGAAGNVKDGKIRDARIALGGIAPVPYLAGEAHDFLQGKTLNEETVSKAADIILKDAKPLAQNGYKVPLAHTLIRRTLLALNT